MSTESLESQFQEHKLSDKTALRFVLPPKDVQPEQEIINFNTPEPEPVLNEKIRPDKLFMDLIPQKRTEEELNFLTEKIKSDGFGEVFVWKEENIYISGYDELRICKELKLPITKRYRSFNSRFEVNKWIYINSMGSLSLSPETKSYIRGELYDQMKKPVGAPLGNKNKIGQNDRIDGATADKLAVDLNISEKTLRRDNEYFKAVNNISQNVGLKFKSDLLNHKLRIPREELLEIAKKPKPEQKQNIKKIADFGYHVYKKEKNREEQEQKNIIKSEQQAEYIIDFKKVAGNDIDSLINSLPEQLPLQNLALARSRISNFAWQCEDLEKIRLVDDFILSLK